MAALFVILATSICGALAGRGVRVSWKECNLDPGFRIDCGYRGITEEQCYQRECCYAETFAMGTPTCYHSIPALSKKCTVNDEEKIDCGHYDIRKEQCFAKGCCWQPSNGMDVPWCYAYQELPIQVGECGVPAIPPNIRGPSRIVGGRPAKRNSWPWQVSLQMDGFHFCGASIINDRWIASAAHCSGAFEWGTVQVVVGQHVISELSSNITQRINVREYIKHEDFEYGFGSNELSNDIMLIQLEEAITFDDEISPVCVPDQGEEFEAGTKCYATGWGTTMLGGDAPDTLQQVMIPILRQETCIEWYSDPQNWYDSSGNAPAVTDKMICAGFEEGGRGTCHGDSGGPFVCHVNNVWKLVGVVSWGGPCAHERTPSVFARVSEYHDWMKKVITENEEKK